MKKPSSHLTGRDRKILEHAHRHRLGTDDIYRHCFFPAVKGNQPVRKVLRRLIERKFLREFSLASVFYYVLAPRGARAVGVKPSEPRPFTEQSLPAALAIAYYCSKTGVKRLTAHEFVTKYSYLCRRGLRSSAYFLEEAKDGMHLGMFITDQATKRRRMLSKIRKVIGKRYKIREFAKLIQAGRFSIVILTGYFAKKQELDAAIARSHRGPVQVRVEVVPELGFLLTRKQGHEVARRDQP